MMQTANISKRFDTKQVLEDVNLKVEDGHISGCWEQTEPGRAPFCGSSAGLLNRRPDTSW